MPRCFDLIFRDAGPRARVLLLDEDAPMTCAAVWDALPLEAEAGHGAYSGTVVGLFMNPNILAPTENASTYIQTGDVMFTHYDANTRHGHPDPISEIYVAYDRYARPTIPGVGLPATANIFGQIIGDAQQFYAACRDLPRLGARMLAAEPVD
jgi:Protein of unknown function (DUF3830)